MFFVSTASGLFGVFFISKGIKVFGWVLIGIWGILSVIVRVLIIMDKRTRNRKEI
jgi:hypothetical protein